MLAAPTGTSARDRLLLWHRSLGLVILALMLLRAAWRWSHPPPPLPLGIGRGERALAHATHILLYAILIAMPLAGWLNAAAAGHPISLFAIASLPPLPAASGRLAQAAIALHLAGQYLIYLLVLLHVAGALNHAVLRRDGVFERMLPGRGALPAATTAVRRPPN